MKESSFIHFLTADKSGDYLRKMMRRTYSEAVQLELPVPFNGRSGGTELCYT